MNTGPKMPDYPDGYFKVDHADCSFELERANKDYPPKCGGCGEGPCKYHSRDSAWSARGSALFPPTKPDEASPALS